MIVKLDVFRVTSALDRPFYWATGLAAERAMMVLRLESEDGCVGWGESMNPDPAPWCGGLAQALLGASPETSLANAAFESARGDAEVEACGAIGMAIWDLCGKIQGVPAAQLMGDDVRQSVPCYASDFYYDNDEAQWSETGIQEQAAELQDCGHRAFKMKIGRAAPAEDLRRLGALRRTLRHDDRIFVDANGVYSLEDAIQVGRGIESLGAGWFEEPMPIASCANYTKLVETLAIPLAGGESCVSPECLEEFAEASQVGVVQPNVGRVGGPTAAKRLALTFGTRCRELAFHHWGTPIGLAATVAVAATLPPSIATIVEYDESPNGLRSAFDGLTPRDGSLVVPHSPGLGVEVDEALLLNHSRTIHQARMS